MRSISNAKRARIGCPFTSCRPDKGRLPRSLSSPRPSPTRPMPITRAAMRMRLIIGASLDWGAYPHNPDQHPIYGASTYNRHADGAGIGFSSRRRPILTMRPGFLTFNDARGSGLRHFPADTHILAWLEEKGFPFDIVTDEDLDDEGEKLIAPYRAVLTGSHPEYHTLRTLDALAELHGHGRQARLSRRQRLLLAHRAHASDAACDRASPCRRRHSRLGGGARRILPRARRRVRRVVAPQSAPAANARRRRLLGPGPFRRHALSALAGVPRSGERLDLRRHRG